MFPSYLQFSWRDLLLFLFSCPVVSESLWPHGPHGATHQGSLFLTISQSLPKCMSIASVMPSSYLILWYPLLLLPSVFLSQGIFQWIRCSHQMVQNIGASTSASVLLMSIQGWFPSWLTGLTESNNILKRSYIMTKWALSQGCKDSSAFANQSMWYTTLTKLKIKIIWLSQ